jgi:integral membrane sensor domain MASE1
MGLIFKDAAGLWEKDKLKPYIGMGLNLVFSILFVKITGNILGVLIPTLLILICIYYPWETRVLFKELFKQSWREYIVLIIRFVATSLVSFIVTVMLNHIIPIDGVLGIISKGIVCVIVMPLLYMAQNFNTIQFKESLGIAGKLARKLRRIS